MSLSIQPFLRLRSFERREGRKTPAQATAYRLLWQQFGISNKEEFLDFQQIFKRDAPVIVEIGFGFGQSLISLAQSHPEINFLGIEMHRPGIGALFLALDKQRLTNVRVIERDAVEVFEQLISPESLQHLLIFFPDPWPKRRHHGRRLIQAEFINVAWRSLCVGGQLHLATDWQDYAQHMLRVMSQAKNFRNMAGLNQFSPRSKQRTLVTKFEKRALRDGRCVWDLQFEKLNDNSLIGLS